MQDKVSAIHPSDGRATGLHPTSAGEALMRNAEKTALDLEGEATARLTPAEHKTLIRLLKKNLSLGGFGFFVPSPCIQVSCG